MCWEREKMFRDKKKILFWASQSSFRTCFWGKMILKSLLDNFGTREKSDSLTSYLEKWNTLNWFDLIKLSSLFINLILFKFNGEYFIVIREVSIDFFCEMMKLNISDRYAYMYNFGQCLNFVAQISLSILLRVIILVFSV